VSPQLDRLAAAGAAAGAALGVAAGVAELTVGPQIRSWVGNKLDTTRLGLATTSISLIALAAALTWLRQHLLSPGQKLLVAAGLLLPGLVGFTTVGRLWFAPGALLLLASVVMLLDLRKESTEVMETLGAHWLAGLTALLAALYIFLGATALGLAGALGIFGGLVILATLAASTRIPRPIRVLLICVAAVPFAAVTWWSVVTPLLAVLLIVIGGLAVNRRSPAAPTARAHGAPPAHD
jgi:hypothetical protein